MKPVFINGNVRANCPTCGGAVTTYEALAQGHGLGFLILDGGHQYNNGAYGRTIYQLMRCAGCGRGGLAEIHANAEVAKGALGRFFPRTVDKLPIPAAVPATPDLYQRAALITAGIIHPPLPLVTTAPRGFSPVAPPQQDSEKKSASAEDTKS